ncbi:ribosome small subunit-dependent GTPase A [Betaproteobacteria bacterium]|nr:ribosome small subunit-dependent GTPase A [Betaproteobacteria bacterium]
MAKTKHRVLSKSQTTITLEPPLNSSCSVPVSILSSIVLNDSIETTLKPEKQQIKILPRKNLLTRSEKVEKKIVANLDHLFLVVTNFPSFNLMNSAKMAIRARNENIPFTVIINKVDHSNVNESFKKKVKALVPFDVCGETKDSKKFKVVQVSLHDDTLMHNLSSKIREIALTSENSEVSICLIGQSGVGKSSLINKLIPSASQKTGKVSTRYKKGRHTTRESRSFEFKICGDNKKKVFIIDTPGIDSFGLESLRCHELAKYFSEWEEINQQNFFCKFKDCRHDCEPGCGVQNFLINLKNDSENFEHLYRRLMLWRKLMFTINKKNVENNRS